MRHRKGGLKLGRTSSHRNAMFRNMVTSLFKHDKIKTTDVKAKELRKWADKMITLAKRGDLHARRQALAVIREKSVVHKLFSEVNDRFGKTSGGYTRITKLGFRLGDIASISLIELIDYSEVTTEKDKKSKPAKKVETVKQEAPKEEAPKETIEKKTDEAIAEKSEETVSDTKEDETPSEKQEKE